MVTAEELEALDLTVWLRAGQRAAVDLGCNQSTISRRVRSCLQIFGLQLERCDGEWQLQGDTHLIGLERQVHQLLRLIGGGPLRLEANYWAGPLLAQPAPPGWITGCFDHIGMVRPLQLLRERVIDAWLASYQPDLPDPDDREWAVFDLCSLPVWLMADAAHPLAGERGLTLGDLQRFPSLALPAGIFPRTEAVLRRQGLWHDAVAMDRYSPACWEGRTADQVTLSYGHSLNHRLAPQLVSLDWNLQLRSGEALVVCRELAEQGPILRLLETLHRRVAALAASDPHICLSAA